MGLGASHRVRASCTAVREPPQSLRRGAIFALLLPQVKRSRAIMVVRPNPQLGRLRCGSSPYTPAGRRSSTRSVVTRVEPMSYMPEDAIVLVDRFVAGEIDAAEFDAAFGRMYGREPWDMLPETPEHELFYVWEEYVRDPELRDPTDLDEDQFRAAIATQRRAMLAQPQGGGAGA